MLDGESIRQDESRLMATGPAAEYRRSRVSLELVAAGAFIMEALTVAGMAILALALAGNAQLESLTDPMKLAVVSAIAVPAALHMMRLYEPRQFVADSGRYQRLAAGTVLGFAFLAVVATTFLSWSVELANWFGLWFALTLPALFVCRILSRRYLRSLLDRGYVNRRIGLLGPEPAMSVFDRSGISRKMQASIVNSFVVEGSDSGTQVLETALQSMRSAGLSGQYDLIGIVAGPGDSDLINRAVKHLALLPIDIVLIPAIETVQPQASAYTDIGGLSALRLRDAPLAAHQRCIKSTFDLVVASTALLFLLPLFAVIAVAIKLDSRGPVFFGQRRHGYNHRVFRMWKFRTMTTLEDGAEIRQASKTDDRITRVGTFLRRTSLDELPQLWNVVKGDMSIVGPRPHAVAHNEHYARLWEEYAQRHRMKPGITGLAQVSGFRGETSDPEQMRQRVLRDIEYMRRWSIWRDLGIIIRTFPQITGHGRAY